MAVVRSMTTKEGDHGRGTYLLRTGYLPRRADPVPDARLAGLQGARRRRGRTCRTSSASRRTAFFARRRSAPASSGRSTPRWSSATSHSFGSRPAATTTTSAEGAGPRPARRRRRRRTPTPGSTCSARWRRTSPTGRPGVVAKSHADRLRPRRPADAVRRRQGVRPRRREGQRSATATAATCSARAACWPAGWSSAACRSSRSTLRRLGHARQQLRRGQERCAARSTRPGRTLMDDLKDRGLLDTTLIVWMGEFGRTPKINQRQRPRPLPERLDAPSWPAAASRAARSSARPAGRHDGRGAAGQRARLPGHRLPALGIDPRSRTSRTSAGRSASWTSPPSRSRRCSREPLLAALSLLGLAGLPRPRGPPLGHHGATSARVAGTGSPTARHRARPRAGAFVTSLDPDPRAAVPVIVPQARPKLVRRPGRRGPAPHRPVRMRLTVRSRGSRSPEMWCDRLEGVRPLRPRQRTAS